MVWDFFHSHGMYSGIGLDIRASVSSTGGLEDFSDPETVKMTMQDTEEGLQLTPNFCSCNPQVHTPYT